MNLRKAIPEYSNIGHNMDWDAAETVLRRVGESDLPCTIPMGTRRRLFQIIRAMGAKTVLDIGTYVGSSALAFALAVDRKGQVVTVDIADANGPSGFWSQVGRPMPSALMWSAGMEDRVEFVTMDAREYLKSVNRRFDFICIDGWHEDFAVYEEIKLALDHLNPNGLIFLDDVQAPGFEIPPGIDRIEGPYKAIESHLAEGAQFQAQFGKNMAFLVAA